MRQPIVKDTYIEGTVSNYYDESISVDNNIGVSGPGYDSTHTVFTLPNGETYEASLNNLQVFCNEASWEEGIHYSYTSATTITTLTAIPKYSRIRFRKN